MVANITSGLANLPVSSDGKFVEKPFPIFLVTQVKVFALKVP